MPRYIEQLNECTDPASADWLWIVDNSAGATDKDRKLAVSKVALLGTASTFTATQTFNPTSGRAIDAQGVSGQNVARFRNAAGVAPLTIGESATALGLPFQKGSESYLAWGTGTSRTSGQAIVRVGANYAARAWLARVTFVEIDTGNAAASGNYAAVAWFLLRSLDGSFHSIATLSHAVSSNRKIAAALATASVANDRIDFRITDASDANVAVGADHYIEIEIYGKEGVNSFPSIYP